MEHIKFFESYFKDKLRNTLEEIQSEVSQYMYYILDDYQVDSSMDTVDITKDKDIEIIYKNIMVENKDFEEFRKRILKLSKIIEKEFNMKFVYYLQSRNEELYINAPKGLEEILTIVSKCVNKFAIKIVSI